MREWGKRSSKNGRNQREIQNHRKKKLMIYIDFHREFHASYFPRATRPPLPWVDCPLSHHESKQYLELLWAVQQWSPENRQITEVGFQNWFIQSGRVQVWFINSLNLNLAVDIYDTSSINSAVLSSGPLFGRTKGWKPWMKCRIVDQTSVGWSPFLVVHGWISQHG